LDGKTVSHVVLCSAHGAVQVGVMNFKYGWPLLAKHRSKTAPACIPQPAGRFESASHLRQNFWPLRTFIDLTDVNSQARHWLEQVANQRRHRETGETPAARFQPEALRALPVIVPDYRDTAEALVHKDLRLSFDGNRYCVPPRYVGRHLTIKANARSVTIYDQHQEIVSYARCWQRGETLGAERFQKELFAQRAAAQHSAEQQRLISWLGPSSGSYLRRLADTDRSLTRQVRRFHPGTLIGFSPES
jgi:hypothetical protein